MWRANNILCLYQPESDNRSMLFQTAMLAMNNQAKLTVVFTCDEYPLSPNMLAKEAT
ncbi:hypothetical protein [Photobacterium indicum]|uniref:hypothetical protein n=1 Tax=Photobacterium indicum TaxID=81447 RepID=UPI0014729659|nr:hypothetical protein [Photobacterium indicum]